MEILVQFLQLKHVVALTALMKNTKQFIAKMYHSIHQVTDLNGSGCRFLLEIFWNTFI